MKGWLQTRTARGVLVIAVLAGFGIWEFGVKAPAQREAQYEGKIVETFRERDLLRGFKSPSEPEHYYYDHYWTIEKASGEEVAVELPPSLWRSGEAGAAVVKVQGQRYPNLRSTVEEDRKIKRHLFQ